MMLPLGQTSGRLGPSSLAQPIYTSSRTAELPTTRTTVRLAIPGISPAFPEAPAAAPQRQSPLASAMAVSARTLAAPSASPPPPAASPASSPLSVGFSPQVFSPFYPTPNSPVLSAPPL